MFAISEDGWKLVRRLGVLVGIVAAAVGGIGAWVSIRDIAAKRSEQGILDWQEPVVYQLIGDAGTDGLTFAELTKQYQLSGLTAQWIEISKDRLTDAALRRILISLVSKRVVMPVGKDKYRILADVDFCGQNSLAEIFNRLSGPALEYLGKQNGQLKPPEVVQYFLTTYKIDDGNAQLLYNYLVTNRCIGVSVKTGFVWNIIKRPEVMAEIGFQPIVIYNAGPAIPITPTTTAKPVPEGQFFSRPSDSGFEPRSSPTYDEPPITKKKPVKAPVPSSSPAT